MAVLTAERPGTAERTAGLGFAFHRNATFISLLIGYAGYYLCRQNLSIAYIPMKAALGLNPVLFGKITSFGTLMYALGKFAFGPLSDSRGGRFVFFLGIAGSVAASLLFSLGSGAAFFMAVWGVNRLFQSMGWGGIVNILSRWFEPESYGTAMGFMSINYQFGGVLASVLVGGLLSWGFGWRALFVIPACILAAIGLLGYPLIKGSPEAVHLAQAKPIDEIQDAEAAVSYFSLFRILLSDKMFCLMCVLSFILTLLRECFSVWMPAYFAEMGASASTAAFKSAIFPLLGCLGTIFAGWFSDRFLSGRRAPVMAGMMAGLVLSLLGLSHIEQASRLAQLDKSAMALFLVGATGFFLLGPYSLVGGGVVALDFGGRRAASTAAGLLDGVGYLGAMLAGVGVAELVVSRGWSFTFGLMAAMTLLGMALCGVLWRVQPKER